MQARTPSQDLANTRAGTAIEAGASLLEAILRTSAIDAETWRPLAASNTFVRALQDALQPRLLRLPEVLARVGVGETHWAKLVKAGEAPQPVKVGTCTCWVDHEITQFIEALRASRQPAANAEARVRQPGP